MADARCWILLTTACTSSAARTGVTARSTSLSSPLPRGTRPWISNNAAASRKNPARPPAPHPPARRPPLARRPPPAGPARPPPRREQPHQPVGRRPLGRVRVEQQPLAVLARGREAAHELVERAVVELHRHLDQPGHAGVSFPRR